MSALDRTVHEFDITLPDGRTLHGYDTGGDGTPVMWHHGAPTFVHRRVAHRPRSSSRLVRTRRTATAASVDLHSPSSSFRHSGF